MNQPHQGSVLMKYRIRGLILLSLLAMGLLAACQPGSPAMDAAAAAAAQKAADGDTSAADEAGNRQAAPQADESTGQESASQNDEEDGGGGSNRCHTGKPHPQIGKLAAEFDVSEDVIAGYLCDEGLSPGAIRTAYHIAGQSGEDVDAVLALRASGLGWGEVRAQLGLTSADEDEEQEMDEQDQQDEDEQGEENSESGVPAYCRPDSGHPQIVRLADELDVPEETVVDLMCNNNLSPGGMHVAGMLADASGESLETVIDSYVKSGSWSDVAADLGVNVTDDDLDDMEDDFDD
jgi:hypothetical protein